MKKENRNEPEVSRDVDIEKDIEIVAFCARCDKALFKGKVRTAIEKHVLIDRLIDHSDFFEGEHWVEIIFPGRKAENVIDSQIFLATGAKSTIDTDKKYPSFKIAKGASAQSKVLSLVSYDLDPRYNGKVKKRSKRKIK